MGDQGGSHGRRAALALAVAAAFVLALAPAALAYRQPTRQERSALTAAWKASHSSSSGGRPTIQQVRVSTARPNYAAVVWGVPDGAAKLDYFKRSVQHAARVAAEKGTAGDVWNYIKRHLVPKAARDDLNPLWTIVFATTKAETVKVTFHQGLGKCDRQFTSTGHYLWSDTWHAVPLTLRTFQAIQSDPSNFINGTLSYADCRHHRSTTHVDTENKEAELFNLGDSALRFNGPEGGGYPTSLPLGRAATPDTAFSLPFTDEDLFLIESKDQQTFKKDDTVHVPCPANNDQCTSTATFHVALTFTRER